MAFYHLPPREVLPLLTKTFWAMSANIDRIEAQKDMRSLAVSLSATSQEAAVQHRKRLELELSDIVKAPEVVAHQRVNAVRDQAGFEELRAMANQSILPKK